MTWKEEVFHVFLSILHNITKILFTWWRWLIIHWGLISFHKSTNFHEIFVMRATLRGLITKIIIKDGFFQSNEQKLWLPYACTSHWLAIQHKYTKENFFSRDSILLKTCRSKDIICITTLVIIEKVLEPI